MFDLEMFIPYRLYQATENASQAFRAVYSELYGLSRAEWRVLFNVAQYGPISAQEIVQRTYLDKTRISRAVQKLIENKWLKRRNDPSDRRRQTLELAARGRTVVDELSVLAEQHNRKIIDIIGAEKARELLAVLEQIETTEFKFDADDARRQRREIQRQSRSS
ncbi:MAG: MarR family winged helix-turn-helix transcriptional regulator [Pseudomonadota bacterium]